MGKKLPSSIQSLIESLEGLGLEISKVKFKEGELWIQFASEVGFKEVYEKLVGDSEKDADLTDFATLELDPFRHDDGRMDYRLSLYIDEIDLNLLRTFFNI